MIFMEEPTSELPVLVDFTKNHNPTEYDAEDGIGHWHEQHQAMNDIITSSTSEHAEQGPTGYEERGDVDGQ